MNEAQLSRSMESQQISARFRIFGSKGWTRKSTLLKIFLSQILPLSPIIKCENLRALILREKFANKRVTQLGGLSSRVKFPSSWLWVELVPAWLKAQKFGPAHLICSIQGPLEMQQWKSWIPGAVSNRDFLFAFLPRTTLGTWKNLHQRCFPHSTL